MENYEYTFENCKHNYDLRKYLIENKNCTAISLRKYRNPMYQKGHFYWCSYWGKAYEVIDVIKEKIKNDKGYIFTRLINVTVRWLDDDKIGNHCTSLDQRDYELKYTNAE